MGNRKPKFKADLQIASMYFSEVIKSIKLSCWTGFVFESMVSDLSILYLPNSGIVSPIIAAPCVCMNY